ncbi:MAG: hypothetical protein HKN72_09410 [Gemmatimonadetes bacterium]|nr:hypothetical protein [Gemmatimonadota bacterium]NNL30657.1 hypothetical protein [Gemmatimonadota bacterium]
MDTSPRRLSPAARVLLALAATWPLLHAGALSGQESVRLSAGDSIRVDGEIVGRILSITGPNMTLVSREAPRCRAGEMHGDRPICDPAPLIRHSMDLGDVVIERRAEKSHLMLRTLAGGVLGAGAFGAAGYFIGPSVGFGRVEGCLLNDSNITCKTGEQRYTQEEIDRRQEASDHKWGAIFFGVIGGTATGILVNKLSVGWVRIQPILSAGEEDPWGLSVTIPSR